MRVTCGFIMGFEPTKRNGTKSWFLFERQAEWQAASDKPRCQSSNPCGFLPIRPRVAFLLSVVQALESSLSGGSCSTAGGLVVMFGSQEFHGNSLELPWKIECELTTMGYSAGLQIKQLTPDTYSGNELTLPRYLPQKIMIGRKRSWSFQVYT